MASILVVAKNQGSASFDAIRALGCAPEDTKFSAGADLSARVPFTAEVLAKVQEWFDKGPTEAPFQSGDLLYWSVDREN